MVNDSILSDPVRNKGTAFSLQERAELGLIGVLPAAVETLEQQVDREYATFCSRPTALDKHLMLRGLQDRNEVLFYRLITDHLAETLPIIYTPTVAAACQEFSHTYRRPRGLFLSYPARDHLREALRNRPRPEVDVIVVTDGERILGIGDQGIGGMGIPIGKLSLYTAIGGIDPARTLPIVLDVGTNDPARLADPNYLGWRHPRITGDDYYAFIDEFVSAVQAELPDVLLQWEDFAIQHAQPILATHRDRLLTFNDDIQGTAAVVLATVLSACRISSTTLDQHRVLLLGAGSAAIGVADYLHTALVQAGLTPEQANSRISLVDLRGLVHQGRDDLSAVQRRFARPESDAAAWSPAPGDTADLPSVVTLYQPTVLIGLSTSGGAFTEPIIRQMAANTEHPVILPLSNPSSRSEADPQDVLTWTEGRGLVATGSPYPDAASTHGPVAISQCNNAYIFPAMGLGVIASGATRVSDTMLLAAATALADTAAADPRPETGLLPPVEDLAANAAQIALQVANQAVTEGLAPHRSSDELAARIANTRWQPRYRPAARTASPHHYTDQVHGHPTDQTIVRLTDAQRKDQHMNALTIPKPELLNPHRLLVNDLDNFTANHEARTVLLERALNGTCSYADQLWDNLNAIRQYLLDCLPPDPHTSTGPVTNGAAPTGPQDEQGWQNWINAFAAVTSVLCGPHGDSGFGLSRAREEARLRRTP